MPNGAHLFASRRTYRLAYASQSADVIGRLDGRLRRLYRRLGARYDFPGAPIPPRPRHMRITTYSALVAAIRDVSRMEDAAASEHFLALAARSGWLGKD
ncbi:MAG: hypothetical protein EXQ88_01680 [Alphaproteobacteria bacterium]|nr:hypothetical protein [Alphaproteobacteria bacterium]